MESLLLVECHEVHVSSLGGEHLASSLPVSCEWLALLPRPRASSCRPSAEVWADRGPGRRPGSSYGWMLGG
jgi:hypothetical protein